MTAAARRPGNLPEDVTTFVGRRREVARTRARLSEARLVTLVGSGGVGKTRLALQVAREARRAFTDGVWMVDLAAFNDPSRVAETVLAALDVRDQSGRTADEKLAEHLRDRQVLIVLDNCEHVLAACAELAAMLLQRCPAMRLLATSREPLGIQGEHLVTVPPLTAPDPQSPPPAAAMLQYESVNLLVERARSVRPDFAVTDANRTAIAELCARLDGIPLAIELAATRLRSLGVDDVVARIDDRFGFLTAGQRDAQPRQRTLRALIDWSYELCTPDERATWNRLSVFAGSFDLAAVEAVCQGDHLQAPVIDVLDQLVAKSIVFLERDGERVRYRLLVTVREYGAKLLREAGLEEETRRRHRDHYLRTARQIVEAWCGPQQAELLRRLRDDHPNLDAALEWSLTTPGEQRAGMKLASALRYHWVVGGFLSEGLRWLVHALEAVPGRDSRRGEALWVAAWTALILGDRASASDWLAECLLIAEELHDARLHAHAAHWSGLLAWFNGDVERSIERFADALAGHEAAGEALPALISGFMLAVPLAYAGQTRKARNVAARALRVSAEHGERWAHAFAHWAFGIVAWREGALDEAQRAARNALEVPADFHDGICVALSVELLAWIAAARADFERSAALLGAARAAWRELGTSIGVFGPLLGGDSLACADRTAAALGARFERTVAAGASVTMDQAIALAIERPSADPSVRAAEPSPLTPREREVADLIAEGMSNRAIADKLVLSPRTIDGHVERIFGKLGFSSRAQVAAWVVERSAHAPDAPERGVNGVIHP